MTVAHNKFSDWTDEEYSGILGYKSVKEQTDKPHSLKSGKEI